MVDSLVPIALTLVTITIEIRLAISAYSMAVVPLASAAQRLTRDRAAWE